MVVVGYVGVKWLCGNPDTLEHDPSPFGGFLSYLCRRISHCPVASNLLAHKPFFQALGGNQCLSAYHRTRTCPPITCTPSSSHKQTSFTGMYTSQISLPFTCVSWQCSPLCSPLIPASTAFYLHRSWRLNRKAGSPKKALRLTTCTR